ncbi:MAG: transglycosylase domain-containing protein, partial [Deltaproteobacteria bacterium]|nr:transglycosylase domain-containing protein [Deltaproteobacteria bacterium]
KEMLQALSLEKKYSKERLLEAYLNLAPCGNTAQGIPAAARLYFDKSPANLSPSEAAFLMSLPQAPGALNPYRGLEGARTRRNHLLNRMAALHSLTGEESERARLEPIRLDRRSQLFRAPHFVTQIKAMLPIPPPARVRTTLDLELQTKIEALTAQAVAEVKNSSITQAAVVVMDHRTREILAWVGSVDFFEAREGQNDGVLAKRQPGSAVKPFTYAAAFDAGLTPAYIVDDSPAEFGLTLGVYKPANYDGRYHGRVDLRTALASSLNVPAVKVLARVGLPLVYQQMKAAGLTSLIHEPDYYGLGLTLGAGEVSLLELTNAYATLASGGVSRPPVMLFGQTVGDEHRAFSAPAAYLVTDILGDDAARATGFGRDSLLALPFPAAAKTGTSKNFRDNWTVGYTSSVVVGVWAGNFDARPMGRVSGITGAGPLWRQVMRLCAAYYPPEPFNRPEGLAELAVCPETGLRATEACP